MRDKKVKRRQPKKKTVKMKPKKTKWVWRKRRVEDTT